MKSNENPDLKITGESTTTGGEYRNVRITGEAEIDGETICDSFRCTGTVRSRGGLHMKKGRLIGEADVSGPLEADVLHIHGSIRVEGKAGIGRLKATGEVYAWSSLSANDFEVKGNVTVKGDCSADRFDMMGSLRVDGLLNADTVEIGLFGRNEAKEIGGDRIRVKKVKGLLGIWRWFKPGDPPRLFAETIEGDDIELVNTTASVVRGKRIVIGRGCEIGSVEYQDELKIAPGATVKAQKQV